MPKKIPIHWNTQKNGAHVFVICVIKKDIKSRKTTSNRFRLLGRNFQTLGGSERSNCSAKSSHIKMVSKKWPQRKQWCANMQQLELTNLVFWGRCKKHRLCKAGWCRALRLRMASRLAIRRPWILTWCMVWRNWPFQNACLFDSKQSSHERLQDFGLETPFVSPQMANNFPQDPTKNGQIMPNFLKKIWGVPSYLNKMSPAYSNCRVFPKNCRALRLLQHHHFIVRRRLGRLLLIRRLPEEGAWGLAQMLHLIAPKGRCLKPGFNMFQL